MVQVDVGAHVRVACFVCAVRKFLRRRQEEGGFENDANAMTGSPVIG